MEISLNEESSAFDSIDTPSTPRLPSPSRFKYKSCCTLTEQRKRLVFISLVSMILSVAGRLHSPIIKQYVYQVNTVQVYGNINVSIDVTHQPCVDTAGNSSDALREEVQQRSADFTMHIEIVASIISIFSNLFIGSYSDVLGRKMVLLLPIIGHLLRNITVPIIIFWDLGLNALYSGYVIDGLFGSSSAIASVILGCYVYAADITSGDKQRTMGLAIVETSMGIGIAATQVAIGLFISKTGFFYPSLTACLLELLCVIIVVVCLPETVPRDRKRFISPLESVKRIATTFWSRDTPKQRYLLLLCLFAFFVGITGEMGVSQINDLYLMNKPFCWGSFQLGVFGSTRDGSGRLGSLALIKLLQKVLSTPLLSVIGAVSEMAKDVVIGLASNNLMIYMSCVVGIGRSMQWPPIRSMMSRMVPPDRQGALFAGIAVVESACMSISHPMFVAVYKAFLDIRPGNTFFFILIFYFIVIATLLVYIYMLKKAKLELVKPESIQSDVPEITQSPSGSVPNPDAGDITKTLWSVPAHLPTVNESLFPSAHDKVADESVC